MKYVYNVSEGGFYSSWKKAAAAIQEIGNYELIDRSKYEREYKEPDGDKYRSIFITKEMVY